MHRQGEAPTLPKHPGHAKEPSKDAACCQRTAADKREEVSTKSFGANTWNSDI